LYIVTGTIAIAPEFREATLDLFGKYVDIVRKEYGLVTYDVCEDVKTPCRFRFYQEWDTKEALLRHTQADTTATFRAALSAMKVSSIEIARFNAEIDAS